MHDLSGIKVLVTGSSKGIGAATVRRLGEAGAYVIAHYSSDLHGAEAATSEIEKSRKLLLQARCTRAGRRNAGKLIFGDNDFRVCG